MFKVIRELNKVNHPLVKCFIYTGESLNPYRCESCATKKQRKLAFETRTLNDIQSLNLPRPECCRTCGMDFV